MFTKTIAKEKIDKQVMQVSVSKWNGYNKYSSAR